MLKQMDLFGGPDVDPLSGEPVPAGAALLAPEPRAADSEPRLAEDAADQFDLFGPAAAERTAIEELIEAGSFAEALARAEVLERERGAFFAVTDAACLRPLAALGADAGLEQVRPSWRSARDLATKAWRREGLATTLLARFAGRRDLDIVGADDVLLADAFVARLREGRADLARLLARDALLAGRALEPDAFADTLVRDVLREDLSPEWLACLGAIRGAWPTPMPVLDASRDEVTTEDDETARAHEAWRCLSVALRVREMPPDAVIAARKRLRELHSELHAQLMRG